MQTCVSTTLQLGKSMHMFIQGASAAIFASTFMKTLFTSSATANRTLVALIYTTENSSILDYAACLFERHFLFQMFSTLCKTNAFFINPFPNKPLFLRVCSTSLLKTLWENEKLLVTSNFSFSHNVFCSFLELSAIFIQSKIVVCKLSQFGRVLNLSFGEGLNNI